MKGYRAWPGHMGLLARLEVEFEDDLEAELEAWWTWLDGLVFGAGLIKKSVMFP